MAEDTSYMIYAPKNAKGLLVQYPELDEYAEFKPSAIKPHDLVFVWWMRNECSPYFNEEDKDKINKCIEKAYPTEQQRKSKTEEFSKGFPDNIKSAFKRMALFNKDARVEMYLYLKTVRENCKALLAQPMDGADDATKDAWAKRAPGLWKLMKDTLVDIERGSMGVTEDTQVDTGEMDGSLKNFRQARR